MAKAKKRSRPGRRPERKCKVRFPLRRPALLAALGLGGWAPAGAADFPPTLELSSLDGTNGFRLDGVAAGDRSGVAVSGAGDVNGDGLADLLIGASDAPNGERSGASYVVFGRDIPFPASLNLSSLDGTNGFRLKGVAAGDRSGRAVSAAGDVNGDGLADLLIGAYGADGFSGASYVVFGRHTPFPASIDLSLLGDTSGFRLDGVAAGDRSGRAVSAAGDVNGDGLSDLLVGAPGTGSNDSGASYVVFGRDIPFPTSLELSSLGGNNGFRLNGEAANDVSGAAVSAAGDVNGDGVADLVIGAPSAALGAGASYVVFGQPPSRPSQPPPPPPPPPPSPSGTCNGLPVTIQGTESSETLIGTSGDDVIDGGGGNDVLCGGDGEIGSSAARAATDSSATQAAMRCSAKRAAMC